MEERGKQRSEDGMERKAGRERNRRNQRNQKWGERDRWSPRRPRDNPKNFYFFSIHKKMMHAAFIFFYFVLFMVAAGSYSAV